MAASVHKNVACEACHVKVLGGYEMTSWGPGKISSRPNPFKKYSLYYGPQEPPILIKDQKGRWMPVKIWPNSAGGMKETVAPKPGLTFRWPKGETRDAYALLGTFSFKGGNNNYLAWIQVEQVAHPLGKSRTCESCHASETQTADVTWRYFDSQGAEPFTGSQKVVADKERTSGEGHQGDLEDRAHARREVRVLCRVAVSGRHLENERGLFDPEGRSDKIQDAG